MVLFGIEAKYKHYTCTMEDLQIWQIIAFNYLSMHHKESYIAYKPIYLLMQVFVFYAQPYFLS